MLKIIASLTLVLVSLLQVEAAQPLTFAPSQSDSSGNLLFSLRGEPNTTYVLETSTDLSEWVPLFSAVTSASGQLDYSLSRNTNPTTSFYFARSQTALEKLIVIPQPDENFSTFALITTNGGTCSLTNLNGVRYTFTVPPFAVTESVAITMTLLTNVVGFPLTKGFGTAVRFEPEGLEFWAPGLLEIRYPTNIAMLDVVSYAFGGDGREMYLLPDLVSPNAIAIPVLHFSGVGSTSGGKEAATTFAHKAINDGSNRASHQMAQAGLAARAKGQLQASGKVILTAGEVVAADRVILSFDVSKLRELTEQDSIERYKHDCTSFTKAARKVLGIGKQVKLLGGVDEIAARYLLTSCEAFANCLKEAKDLCPIDRLKAIEKFSALQQFMGRVPACPPPDENQFLRECQPEWYGSVRYTETGTTNSVDTVGPTRIEATETIAFSGTAYVMTSQSFPGLVDLRLEGPASGFYKYDEYSTETLVCGRLKTVDYKGSTSGTGNQKYRLTAVFLGTKLSTFSVGPIGNIELASGFGSTTEVEPSCSSDDPGRYSYHGGKFSTFQSPASLTLFEENALASVPFITPDSIVGTYTTETLSSGYPVKGTWTFNLQRKK